MLWAAQKLSPLDFYRACYGYELNEDEANLILAAKKIGLMA